MTNKTTEQDMEAESVDKNDATLNKSPDINKEIVAEALDELLDDEAIQDELDETRQDAAEDTTTEIPETEAPEPAEEVFDDSVIAPGSLSRALKKCRDQADMSLEDAAGEMRLPLVVMKALEEENFADLPDPPYVRGYLRSYARLNESDPTNLINHYETLRGADPKDIASFTPTTPRYQPNNKKAVSPTTIKLAGFSMIIMLLVVLSMIPAVSQWASDTWKSFSEPQNQQLATGTTQNTGSNAANDDKTKNDTQEAQDTDGAGATGTSSGSNSDTATPDNSEQLALNQDATDSNAQDTDTATDSTPAGEQDKTPEQAADAAGSDTASDATNADATQATADTDTAEAADADSNTTDKEQTAATDTNTDSADATTAAGGGTSSDTDNSANATQETTDAEKQEATDEAAAMVEAEAARQQQEREQAEKAAAEKAEADRVAAQQAAEAAKQEEKFQQPIDGNVLIRLVFSQDVWMSIKDGRGKTIFGALSSAGTRKELKASTPLQFKVGNAPGVQIYLNGQLIDQRPYTRGSVSTFRAN